MLIITQEPDAVWTERMREHELSPEWIFFQRGPDNYPRPFRSKPDSAMWQQLITHVAKQIREGDYKLVVIDPLADFWPVKDENAAGEVTDALVLLRELTEAAGGVPAAPPPRAAVEVKALIEEADSSRPLQTCCWSCPDPALAIPVPPVASCEVCLDSGRRRPR